MNERKIQECPKHGNVTHVLEPKTGYFRCQRCRNDHVIEYRRNKKRILVKEAGGKCKICGYNKHFGSLQFHHLDPAKKEFQVSHKGLTRSLEVSRQEAKKCVLLCANCHQEVEDGVSVIPSYANE